MYISGEINKSKAQGDLYDYIKDQEPGVNDTIRMYI